MEEARKIVAQNRKAHFNYIVTDSIECGIALEGSEVKSIKAGNISFGDSFAFIENGEVWLQNFHISEYSFSSVFNHEPDRKKKLLLHKDEIKRLQRKTEENIKRPSGIFDSPIDENIVERILYINKNGKPTK